MFRFVSTSPGGPTWPRPRSERSSLVRGLPRSNPAKTRSESVRALIRLAKARCSAYTSTACRLASSEFLSER